MHPVNDTDCDLQLVTIMGVEVTPMTVAGLMAVIEQAVVSDRKRCLIGNHNLHSISLYHRRPIMRRFYSRADYVFVDGMPLIAHARLLGLPVKRSHRTTVLDWLPALMDLSRQGQWRVLFVGGKPNVGRRAQAAMQTQFPGLDLNVHHGYFDVTSRGVENEAVLRYIESLTPDILLVGMGMPRQEEWIIENLGRLEARVIIPIGAGMDYIAGAVPTPPRWMGKIGLEWVYRLASEPRRLFQRYLVEPWSLVPLALRDYHARVSGASASNE